MVKKPEMTTKEMFRSIDRKIEGLTHEISTLEAMAKNFLNTALEVRELKNSLREVRIRMDASFECKFHHTDCNSKCKLEELMERD